MEFVTTETVPGRETVEALGIARGNTVKARNVGRDITQSIRNITGGELKAYSELLTDARDEALERTDPARTGVKAGRVVGLLTAGLAVLFWGNVVLAAAARYSVCYVPAFARLFDPEAGDDRSTPHRLGEP